jgi:hypothetical protein
MVALASPTTLTFSTVSVDYLPRSVVRSRSLSWRSTRTLRWLAYANGSVTRSMRTFEDHHRGSTSFDLDTTANAGAYIERQGIDLDEVQAELRGYKLISSIYPQGRLGADAQALVFTVGPRITRTTNPLGRALRPSTKPITSSTTTLRGDTWPSRSNRRTLSRSPSTVMTSTWPCLVDSDLFNSSYYGIQKD